VSLRFFESADPVDELDTVTLQDPGQWLYPADIDVLLEAMKAQRTGKFRTKNQQDALGKGDASGRAAGYVRSEQVQDVYGQGDIPLSLTTGKKRAWMPNLNRGQSTTAHPFTGETLSVVSKSEPILDGCKQSAGLSIYHFPYFAGEQTVEKMRYLYTLMWDAYQQSERDKESDSDDGGRITTTPIQRFYKRLTDEVEAENPSEEDSIADTLRFWTINIVHYQDKRKRAIAEAAGMSALRAVDVAQAATSVATDLSNSRLFQTYSSWDFNNPETDFLAQITSPYYFISTTVTTTDEDEVDANEPGYAFYQQLLRDEPISLSQLLEAYVSHIDDRYDQSADDGRRVPILHIIEQFAQLATLGRSGLLEVDIPSVSDTVDPYAVPVETDEQSTDTITDTMTDEDDNPDDNDKGDSKPTPKERAIAEKEAYNRMITEQPVLSESPSRRAVFTLGSLITTVSGYQAAKGTKPLNSRLNPTTITKHNIQEYVTDVLEQINTYATAEGGANIWKYETQTSQLAEDLTVKPVAEWELSSADIQYHLSLGMAFGAQRHD